MKKEFEKIQKEPEAKRSEIRFIERIFGSKRALTWFIHQIMAFTLFICMCFYYPSYFFLYLFIVIEADSLIVLKLIDFEKIKTNINIGNKAK